MTWSRASSHLSGGSEPRSTAYASQTPARRTADPGRPSRCRGRSAGRRGRAGPGRSGGARTGPTKTSVARVKPLSIAGSRRQAVPVWVITPYSTPNSGQRISTVMQVQRRSPRLMKQAGQVDVLWRCRCGSRPRRRSRTPTKPPTTLRSGCLRTSRSTATAAARRDRDDQRELQVVVAGGVDDRNAIHGRPMSSSAPQPPSAWKKSLSVVCAGFAGSSASSDRRGGRRGLDLGLEDVDQLLLQVVLDLVAAGRRLSHALPAAGARSAG